VLEARRLWQRIQESQSERKLALQSVDQDLLTEAIDEAEALGFTTADLNQSKEFRGGVTGLEEAMAELNTGKLTDGIQRASELRMDENEVVVRAKTMLQNTILTRNKAVSVAFDAGGATDSHERALQQVVEMADG
jgi:hypothetical protein